MGQSQYGLHHWLSTNPKRKQCHLRCYRSTLKSCSLPSHSRVYYYQSVRRTCMCRELYHFMVFLWKSILIEVAFSPLDSGKAFKMLWELISPLVQLSTLNLAVKSKGLTKFWKTCSEPV